MVHPLLVAALVVAGAGTLYVITKKAPTKKKKKKKTAPSEDPTEPAPTEPAAVSTWYLFGDDCKWLDKEVPSNEEGRQFILDQIEAFGGLGQLGDLPGNVEANQEFARRFEIHMFEQMVSPTCADAILNQGIKTPPLLVEFIDGLTVGVDMFMMDLGYDMGMGVALEGAPMGPSLVDVVRGV